MSKIIGIIIFCISIYFFKSGFYYKGDNGPGKYITNLRLIGGGIILLILAIAFFFNKKSILEIF